MVRTDQASRVISASPDAIYRAFVDPDALTRWLPPAGMTGKMHRFDPREGGGYRMELIYREADSRTAKSSENSDIVEARFGPLVPGKSVVQYIDFEADDPAFQGTMTMTWSLEPVAEGTRVTITAENVPSGIRKEDHDAGLTSSLANLAEYLE